MKILFATILMGSLCISTLAFSVNYAQTQNRMDNADNDLKSIQSQADQKENSRSSDQIRIPPEGDPQSGASSGTRSNLEGQSQFEKDTGINDKIIPGREK